MKSSWLATFVVAAMAFLTLAKASPDEPDKAPTPQAVPMIGKEPGEVRDDNGLQMKLVWCPPGFFTMEEFKVIEEPAVENVETPISDDDEVDLEDNLAPKKSDEARRQQVTKITPVKVFVTTGYWLGKYEVTQAEWKQLMRTEPWKGKNLTKDGDDFPAMYVSWDDAMTFCRKLTEQERQAGRLSIDWEYTLPTEAQWERACRARTQSKFSFVGDESKLGENGWFDVNASNVGEEYAHRVGQKKPNPWGFCDMHGNVWEWCRDIYAERLPGGRDPEVRVSEGASARVFRGGSWNLDAYYCQAAVRSSLVPSYRSLGGGFRVARSTVRPIK